jgi:hypothetical protein
LLISVTAVWGVNIKAMNDYGSDPFFENVDRRYNAFSISQSALELGMTCDHEGEDFFVSLWHMAPTTISGE